MTSLQAIGFAAAVSIAISVGLSVLIYRPLQSLLVKVCAGEEAVQFWARFTLTMLFLVPLMVSVSLGVPSATELATRPDAGALAQQVLSTSLLGSFLTMLGMGLWVSALIRRIPLPPVAKPYVER